MHPRLLESERMKDEVPKRCIERNIDIAQAAFLAGMSEDQTGQLILAHKMLATIIPVEFIHNTLVFVSRQEK